MPAAKKTLVHDNGTTFNLSIVYKDSNKNPVDLTGHRVTFDVFGRMNHRHEAVVDSAGNITIKVDDEDTARWGVGRLSYSVDHHLPNGERYRMFFGPLDVKGVE